MKIKTLLSGLAAVAMAMAMNACSDQDTNAEKDVAAGNLTTVWIGAVDKADCATRLGVVYTLTNPALLSWSSSNVYCLCGDVRVPAGNTLNIAAGTQIRGFKGTNASLTILPGAKINAIGTAANPIIFTSSETAGARAPLDWGGVFILGNAQINTTTAPIDAEGFAPLTPAPTYGSLTALNNGENSGTLQYVRIEFGGMPTSIPNNEKNGLTMCGVGSGTTIDHIQVSSGADDGFEWFGGTVNAKYLISHKNSDDDFDTDLGYTGNVQFGVVSRDPARAVQTANGFESDNDPTGAATVPVTSPIFSNFTVIGPIQCALAVNASYQDGIYIRRASRMKIYNSVIVGWARHQGFADATVLSSPGAYITAVRSPVVTTDVYNSSSIWTSGPGVTGGTAANCISTDNAGIYRMSGLPISAWNLANVNFIPITAVGYISPLLAVGTNAAAINPFFTANTTTSAATTYFKGARRVADDNGWNLSSGWVNWQPETTAYFNDGLY